MTKQKACNQVFKHRLSNVLVVIVVVHSHPLLFKQIQGGEVMDNKQAHLPTSLMTKSFIVQSG